MKNIIDYLNICKNIVELNNGRGQNLIEDKNFNENKAIYCKYYTDTIYSTDRAEDVVFRFFEGVQHVIYMEVEAIEQFSKFINVYLSEIVESGTVDAWQYKLARELRPDLANLFDTGNNSLLIGMLSNLIYVQYYVTSTDALVKAYGVYAYMLDLMIANNHINAKALCITDKCALTIISSMICDGGYSIDLCISKKLLPNNQEVQNIFGTSLLHLVYKTQNSYAFKALLESGANPTYQDNNKCDVLSLMIKDINCNNYKESIEILLNYFQKNAAMLPNSYLSCISDYRNVDILRIILKYYPDYLIQPNMSPILTLCGTIMSDINSCQYFDERMKGDVELVKIFLENKAEVYVKICFSGNDLVSDSTNKNKKAKSSAEISTSIFDIIIHTKNYELIKLLLDCGGVYEKTLDGKKPDANITINSIKVLCQQKQWDILSLIMQYEISYYVNNTNHKLMISKDEIKDAPENISLQIIKTFYDSIDHEYLKEYIDVVLPTLQSDDARYILHCALLQNVVVGDLNGVKHVVNDLAPKSKVDLDIRLGVVASKISKSVISVFSAAVLTKQYAILKFLIQKFPDQVCNIQSHGILKYALSHGGECEMEKDIFAPKMYSLVQDLSSPILHLYFIQQAFGIDTNEEEKLVVVKKVYEFINLYCKNQGDGYHYNLDFFTCVGYIDRFYSNMAQFILDATEKAGQNKQTLLRATFDVLYNADHDIKHYEQKISFLMMNGLNPYVVISVLSSRGSCLEFVNNTKFEDKSFVILKVLLDHGVSLSNFKLTLDPQQKHFKKITTMIAEYSSANGIVNRLIKFKDKYTKILSMEAVAGSIESISLTGVLFDFYQLTTKEKHDVMLTLLIEKKQYHFGVYEIVESYIFDTKQDNVEWLFARSPKTLIKILQDRETLPAYKLKKMYGEDFYSSEIFSSMLPDYISHNYSACLEYCINKNSQININTYDAELRYLIMLDDSLVYQSSDGKNILFILAHLKRYDILKDYIKHYEDNISDEMYKNNDQSLVNYLLQGYDISSKKDILNILEILLNNIDICEHASILENAIAIAKQNLDMDLLTIIEKIVYVVGEYGGEIMSSISTESIVDLFNLMVVHKKSTAEKYLNQFIDKSNTLLISGNILDMFAATQNNFGYLCVMRKLLKNPDLFKKIVKTASAELDFFKPLVQLSTTYGAKSMDRKKIFDTMLDMLKEDVEIPFNGKYSKNLFLTIYKEGIHEEWLNSMNKATIHKLINIIDADQNIFLKYLATCKDFDTMQKWINEYDISVSQTDVYNILLMYVAKTEWKNVGMVIDIFCQKPQYHEYISNIINNKDDLTTLYQILDCNRGDILDKLAKHGIYLVNGAAQSILNDNKETKIRHDVMINYINKHLNDLIEYVINNEQYLKINFLLMQSDIANKYTICANLIQKQDESVMRKIENSKLSGMKVWEKLVIELKPQVMHDIEHSQLTEGEDEKSDSDVERNEAVLLAISCIEESDCNNSVKNDKKMIKSDDKHYVNFEHFLSDVTLDQQCETVDVCKNGQKCGVIGSGSPNMSSNLVNSVTYNVFADKDFTLSIHNTDDIFHDR